MKTAKGKRDKGSDHGGLDAWFSGHGQGKSKAKGKAPYGDWIAITPVKKTVTKDDGSKKTYQPGDIVGPCGISKDPDWKGVTNNGKDPLKCMPRQKAHDLDKSERAELAKNKKKQESKKPDTGAPVNTPTFGEKAKKIKKKALLEQIEALEKSASKCSGGNCPRCWEGYEPVPGKKPFSKGSCRKKSSSEDRPKYKIPPTRVFTESELKGMYGPVVEKRGKAGLYRSENYLGRTTASVQWTVTWDDTNRGGIIIVGSYKTKKEALKMLEAYKD